MIKYSPCISSHTLTAYYVMTHHVPDRNLHYFQISLLIEQLELGRQGTYDRFQCTMYSVQHLMVPRLVYGILNI
jgi:hypothetical protein